MAKGTAFLLKVGDDEIPPQYSTVAGLRATAFAINSEVVEAWDSEPNACRELISGGGARSMSISAAGIFLGSEAEATIRARALAGTVDRYALSFEDGTGIQGRFLVLRLDYAGDFNGERNYSLQLESSGPVEAKR